MFFVYRSPSSDSEVFEVLSSKIDSLLQKYPAAEVAVFGDFNVHNQEWLIHARSTDTSDLAAQAFALCHNLTQIVTSQPTNTGLLVDIARKICMRPKAVMLHMYVIPLQPKSSSPPSQHSTVVTQVQKWRPLPLTKLSFSPVSSQRTHVLMTVV